MNDAALQFLKRLYGSTSELVVIVDADWKTVWSTKPVTLDRIPERLQLRADCWENGSRPLLLDDAPCSCTLQCSREDGLRILQISPAPKTGGMDLGEINSVLQSMISECTALHTELDDLDLHDQTRYLNALTGNILQIYRMTYLVQELERGRNGGWAAERFSLGTVLESLEKAMRIILCRVASVGLENEADRDLFTSGNAVAFSNAVLTAVLLCIKQPEQRQQILMTLSEGDGTAELCIQVTPEPERRDDLREQNEHSGNMEQERALLEQYGALFGVWTMFAEQQGSAVCRMRIPLCESGGVITLHSAGAGVAPGYFDPVPVILARFRSRNYFG